MMIRKSKRKNKKHKSSIIHEKDGTCYLCMKLDGDYTQKRRLHEHHIFGGPNRSISEAEGLKVYLCLEHHTVGPAAVHNNHENMRILQRIGQRAYEKTHSRKQFMELIGKNYLEGDTVQQDPEKSTAAGFILLNQMGG